MFQARSLSSSNAVQVLALNAGNLCPEYKEGHKRAWGIENTLLNVSFAVPAQRPSDIIDDVDRETVSKNGPEVLAACGPALRKECASCGGKHAAFKCTRCEVTLVLTIMLACTYDKCMRAFLHLHI